MRLAKSGLKLCEHQLRSCPCQRRDSSHAADRYRSKVAQIHEALTKGDAASREAITVLRELIDHILVTPTERPAPVELRVVGNPAALLVENTPGTGVAVSMVAGACNQLYSHGLPCFCFHDNSVPQRASLNIFALPANCAPPRQAFSPALAASTGNFESSSTRSHRGVFAHLYRSGAP